MHPNATQQSWLDLAVSSSEQPAAGFQRVLLQAASAPPASPAAAGSQLCGATEYYCGDNDVILDVAYQAITGGSCQQDKDIGVWICGDHVVTDAVYQSTLTNKGSCQADCSLSGSSLAMPSQYYWQVSGWTACTNPCDGGIQTRTAACINSADGSQAGSSLCDQGSRPSVRRACNTIACAVQQRGLTLGYTPWGLCETDCGAGSSLRSAYCANGDGALVSVESCTGYSGAALLRDCASPVACKGPRWQSGPWGRCSKVCDGGVASRNLTCVDASGKSAASSTCANKLVPPSTYTCNTAPCVGYSWQFTAFGPCSKACGGGIATRQVTCVDQFQNPANVTLCPGKQPADQVVCNVTPCDFCSTTNCAGQGVCQNGVCTCQPGYRGQYCEIAPSCAGILDQNGNCCDPGVVSSSGICCGKTAILDSNAQCCESGVVDACGVCDGTGKLVDVQNKCCSSGVLDGNGYCCDSGLLDECGVCDGTSQTCALHAIVAVTLTQPATFFNLGSQAFVDTFVAFVAGILQAQAASLEVTDFVLSPTAAAASASPTAQSLAMQVDFLVNPSDSFTNLQDLRTSLATERLQAAVGQASTNQLFILTALPLVERAAICGNQVCEAGERAPSTATESGCPGDCSFDLNTCPGASATSAPCSGKGWCLSAVGICQCYFGYGGADCSLCADGYMKSGGVCARYVRAQLPLLNAQSGKAGVYVILAVGIGMSVLGAIFLGLAGFVIHRQRRQIRYYKLHGRRSKRGHRGLTSRGASFVEPTHSDGRRKSSARMGILDMARSLSNMSFLRPGSSAVQRSAASASVPQVVSRIASDSVAPFASVDASAQDELKGILLHRSRADSQELSATAMAGVLPSSKSSSRGRRGAAPEAQQLLGQSEPPLPQPQSKEDIHEIHRAIVASRMHHQYKAKAVKQRRASTGEYAGGVSPPPSPLGSRGRDTPSALQLPDTDMGVVSYPLPDQEGFTPPTSYMVAASTSILVNVSRDSSEFEGSDSQPGSARPLLDDRSGGSGTSAGRV
ncbi:hypothetical protein WJX72_005402 [[Myrmecia] bisecta]|uniref:EGF-like domain-containing protein n=1 Tax=[Myrmecia] bisecta TaxID=41462 RepID=A0AAW1Q3Z7_9CHLO